MRRGPQRSPHTPGPRAAAGASRSGGGWGDLAADLPPAILREAESLFDAGGYDLLLDDRSAIAWHHEAVRFCTALEHRLARAGDTPTESLAIQVRLRVLSAVWFATGSDVRAVSDFYQTLDDLYRDWGLRLRAGLEGDLDFSADTSSGLPAIQLTRHRDLFLVHWYRFGPAVQLWSARDVTGTLVHLDVEAALALDIPKAVETDIVALSERWERAIASRRAERYNLGQERAHVGFPDLPPRLWAAGTSSGSEGAVDIEGPADTE